jgi:hypothetical protein
MVISRISADVGSEQKLPGRGLNFRGSLKAKKVRKLQCIDEWEETNQGQQQACISPRTEIIKESTC